MILSHCSLIGLELPQWPGPPLPFTFARVRRADPGRNLGPGRQSGLPLAPAWAKSRPVLPSPSDLIRRPSVHLGRIKTSSGRGQQNPSVHSVLSFLSPSTSLSSLSAHPQPPRGYRARASSDHGAVAGPLADARAPQRVSTPPSSGLAAAPPCRARRASSPARLLLSRRRRAGSALLLPRRRRWVRSPFPFFPVPSLFWD